MPRVRIAVLSLAVVALLAGCGSSSSSPSASRSAAPASVAVSASAAGALTIVLTEWKVAAASTLKAGPAVFTITNAGTIPHELLIFKSDLAPTAYPTDSAGTIDEEGTGVTLVSDGDNLDPAGSQPRSVDLKAGTYLFVCNIPTHFKQGMYIVVTVSA